jgi:hypothetical protein
LILFADFNQKLRDVSIVSFHQAHTLSTSPSGLSQNVTSFWGELRRISTIT